MTPYYAIIRKKSSNFISQRCTLTCHEILNIARLRNGSRKLVQISQKFAHIFIYFWLAGFLRSLWLNEFMRIIYLAPLPRFVTINCYAALFNRLSYDFRPPLLTKREPWWRVSWISRAIYLLTVEELSLILWNHRFVFRVTEFDNSYALLWFLSTDVNLKNRV